MKFVGSLLLAACTLLPAALSAQQAAPAFPVRPVVLVVPYTPNSGSDILARIVGPRLSARWGQPVVVENRPGASGNIGASQVASAPADGHTLLMMISTFTITPSLYKKMPYDPVADFAPVGKLAEANFALAVSNTVPARDVKSLVAHLKQNPGKFNFATPGNGTPQHLAMALFMDRYGVELAHVPYKGIGPALTELGGGTVEVMFATVHSVLPLVQAGKVRLLGVSGPARSPLVPDVPSFREQGVDMADGIDAWYGVLAPARTSPELVKRLNRDFTEVITSSEVKAQAAKQGITIDTTTPVQLGELIKSDLKRWKQVVTDHHITAD